LQASDDLVNWTTIKQTQTNPVTEFVDVEAKAGPALLPDADGAIR
jgi:hypothetical protein